LLSQERPTLRDWAYSRRQNSEGEHSWWARFHPSRKNTGRNSLRLWYLSPSSTELQPQIPKLCQASFRVTDVDAPTFSAVAAFATLELVVTTAKTTRTSGETPKVALRPENATHSAAKPGLSATRLHGLSKQPSRALANPGRGPDPQGNFRVAAVVFLWEPGAHSQAKTPLPARIRHRKIPLKAQDAGLIATAPPCTVRHELDCVLRHPGHSARHGQPWILSFPKHLNLQTLSSTLTPLRSQTSVRDRLTG
jgi:hypothetical protein